MLASGRRTVLRPLGRVVEGSRKLTRLARLTSVKGRWSRGARMIQVETRRRRAGRVGMRVMSRRCACQCATFSSLGKTKRYRKTVRGS